MTRRFSLAKVLCCLAGVAGCVILRPEWQDLVAASGMEARWVSTSAFRHLVLSNHQRGTHLRIYVEGDGSPWIQDNRIAIDPTPTNPVLLRLMHRADHAAIYLGRPCYFGAATDSSCNPRWWTFDRYSQPIIESMCVAANSLIKERQAETVQLVGFSGGGALVVGMSTCTDRLVAITTIAGNLVPSAWARHHGYTQLRDLTLVDTALPAQMNIREIHWQCAYDEQVPTYLTAGYFVKRPNAKRKMIRECSHSTGWAHVFPQIISPNTPE